VTYSIVARDPITGDLGVAVQSHWFAAGRVVPWAESGVGAVATQSFVEVSYGPKGLALMREGLTPEDALVQLLEEDEGAATRQVAMLDTNGNVAVHTGSGCIRMAGHRTGDDYSVQANMMARDTVWDAMAEAFEASSGDLAYRLLDALDAAEAEGGDVRGRQAAGILIVRGEAGEKPWEDTLLDLRVDDHPAPLVELRRLVELSSAYDRLDEAEHLELGGDVEGALREQEAALASHPDEPEIAFWTALSQAGLGRVDDARRTIRVALERHDGWGLLLDRLAEDGFLQLSEETIRSLREP
jgi:uncharacterized Ntn-hydrolase superfamily protein